MATVLAPLVHALRSEQHLRYVSTVPTQDSSYAGFSSGTQNFVGLGFVAVLQTIPKNSYFFLEIF